MTGIKNMSDRALQLSDGSDQTLVEAIRHHHAGRVAEAEELYQTILNSPSANGVANYGFGLLCASQGRSREAVDAYRRAITIQPNFVDAYINLGTTVLALGRQEEAMTLYRQAIAIDPANIMAQGNLGKALQDMGRVDEAIAAYRAVIACQPDDALAHANLGAALLERQAWDESAMVTRRAITLHPNNAMAHANLGTVLLKLGRHEEALAACRQAIALRPQGVAIHASLGGAMLELGALREAVALCQHAITLDPDLPDAYFNLSHALKAMNDLGEAEHAARQAIALRPDAAEYHFHLAHILLLRGDMAAGWPEYDWRWKLPDFAWIGQGHGIFSRPPWTGEDIRDKTILIYTEQGLGDIILFARYLSLIVREAGRVIVAVHPPLLRLLKAIDGITTVSIRGVPLPDFDVHCPLMSLPRAFATRLDNIPATIPYLRISRTERMQWAGRINSGRPGGDALRVGIVWAGNPATKRDHFRSPGLSGVASLFSVPGIDFVVMQMGAGREDCLAHPLPPHVLDLGEEIQDLTDTAAIMSGLDLMISSCTAPLHLAGALGVRTWAMIPYAPYFPWLLGSTDTPWYPSMRLYRQEQPGRDWSDVVGRIAVDLSALARSWSDSSSRSSPDFRQITPINDLYEEVPLERPCMERTTSDRIPDPAAGAFNELARCREGLMLYNRNDTYVGASLREYGEFSAEETALFRIIVQPGRTVMDIGANIGAHTVDLSRLVGSGGSVHAFEPQRMMFQVLCANVALNSCSNVFTHQVAVGAVNDTLLVPSLDPCQAENYGGLSLLGSRSGESVPLITIDSLDLDDCQFIKLDVEGMEAEALLGAIATIRRFRPFLYVENDRQTRSAELISLIQRYGYRLYWHFSPLYDVNNFRGVTDDIFGAKVSVNMICIPSEISQSSLTNLREVTDPTDSVLRW
jgi:FkbM family methyltransferase